MDSDADPLKDFKPKDESDYMAHLSGKKLVKTRRHERLVRECGEWAAQHGLTPITTEHPKDLILRKGDAEFLVEAKIIRNGNSTQGVREAGQLLTYRFFLYPVDSPVESVGLFSEPLGDAYVTFLDSFDILVVWHENGEWKGSTGAVSRGLALD